MLHAKQASKRKRRSKAVPVLGAVGLLSLAGGASTQAAGPAADIPTRHIEPSHELTLSEEEVSDVSLATFYVFDKEDCRLPRRSARQRRVRRVRPWMRRRRLQGLRRRLLPGLRRRLPVRRRLRLPPGLRRLRRLRRLAGGGGCCLSWGACALC